MQLWNNLFLSYTEESYASESSSTGTEQLQMKSVVWWYFCLTDEVLCVKSTYADANQPPLFHMQTPFSKKFMWSSMVGCDLLLDRESTKWGCLPAKKSPYIYHHARLEFIDISTSDWRFAASLY